LSSGRALSPGCAGGGEAVDDAAEGAVGEEDHQRRALGRRRRGELAQGAEQLLVALEGGCVDSGGAEVGGEGRRIHKMYILAVALLDRSDERHVRLAERLDRRLAHDLEARGVAARLEGGDDSRIRIAA